MWIRSDCVKSSQAMPCTEAMPGSSVVFMGGSVMLDDWIIIRFWKLSFDLRFEFGDHHMVVRLRQPSH